MLVFWVHALLFNYYVYCILCIITYHSTMASAWWYAPQSLISFIYSSEEPIISCTYSIYIRSCGCSHKLTKLLIHSYVCTPGYKGTGVYADGLRTMIHCFYCTMYVCTNNLLCCGLYATPWTLVIYIMQLQRELDNFDPSFFEEIEDLKYNYHESQQTIARYEQQLQQLCRQFGVALPDVWLCTWNGHRLYILCRFC